MTATAQKLTPGEKVIVYSGEQYGKVHDVVEVKSHTVTVRRGDYVATVPVCDVEKVEEAK